MSTYASCPNCDNSKDGDSIWSCRECGFVHCENCDKDNGHCPNCEADAMKKVGTIEDDSGSDEENDAEYTECPKCGKNDDGDKIWECKDCGCEHCEDCDPDGSACPKCGGKRMKVAGLIKNKDSEDSDD